MFDQIITVINQGGVINWTLFVIVIFAAERAMYRYILLKGKLRNIEKGTYGAICSFKSWIVSTPKGSNEFYENRLNEMMFSELLRLSRGEDLQAVVASTAPLLGLLGTVVGIVKTFSNITLFGFADPVILAEGISLALITTEAGLLVACSALFFHSRLSILSQRVERSLLQSGRETIMEVCDA